MNSLKKYINTKIEYSPMNPKNKPFYLTQLEKHTTGDCLFLTVIAIAVAFMLFTILTLLNVI